MLASTCTDFVAGRIDRAEQQCGRRERAYLILALAINLGILVIFKYAGFFADSADGLLALLGLGQPVPIVHLVLPLGISFYTFNSMSYTIDVYRGRIAPERSLLRYCAFVALFPHLIAGPIVRYEQMARAARAPAAAPDGRHGLARRSSSSPAAARRSC